MDYRIFRMDGAGVGGMMAVPPDAAAAGMPPQWLGYVSVADVDESVARIVAAGGTAHMPVTDVQGVGRMALVADPQGASLYVMVPAVQRRGHRGSARARGGQRRRNAGGTASSPGRRLGHACPRSARSEVRAGRPAEASIVLGFLIK
jgi:hypothetical protein